MPEAVIVDAVRTPIGRAVKGSLKDVRADDLAAVPLEALQERNPDVDFWPGNRWTKGSYSYWKVGQYTRFAGVEREVEGRLGACHFAGEHTSIDFQGYLQGAVETGERAADEILADLK